MALGDSPRNVPGDSYRIKASDLKAKARQEPNAARRMELDTLAMAYLRLADQAERNSHNNIVYETPPRRPVVQQQQQQQQPRAKDDSEGQS
jgi:hypothetical protein